LILDLFVLGSGKYIDSSRVRMVVSWFVSKLSKIVISN
jgi:hypothetical protein